MAILSFEIQADYDKVIKLREEIVRLENVMKNFDASTTQDTIRKTEQQLASNREALDKLTSSAAKAATAMNGTFSKGMSNAQAQMSQTSKIAKEQAAAIDALYGKLASTAAKLGISLSALGLGNRIMKTRGDFQQLEMAFQTMLGSAEKGQTLMNQLVRTAAVTPFDLKGVANGAKQLLAYGVAAEDVNDTVVKLGDIAAGLSIPLNDLIYVYGTTITQGRMFTMDLRQLQGRGVPIAEALAKQLGIAKNEVGDAVTKGKVDAETFKKAMLSLSSAGSQFGGLMDAQSKTITGQIANIEDAIDMMFNDMGKKSEGVINSGLSAVSYLIENYEKVGKILLVAAVAFGTYKASLIATQAIEKIKNNSAISGLEEEITKVNEEIAARERLNATIANQPTQGKTTVGTTSTPSHTGNEQIDGLQAQLAERNAILSQIKQEEAVEKQAKLNIAATEHTAAQSQLSIAQEKQKMAQSSLSLAEQEYSVALKEKQEAEARVILANQEVDVRKKALLNAQQGGSDTDKKNARKSLDAATSERDAAYAAQTAAYSRYNSASQNLSAARDASNIAITQAETAALNEQTAAQNLHNAAVEKANALNALNAGETNEAAIAARNEVIEIEAKTAALKAEIERKRELLSLPAEGETEISPEVTQAQSRLDEQTQINDALDAEFQKRVDIANQDLAFAQENYKAKSDALDVAEQEYLSSQENLSLAVKNKEAIDEKVQSSKEYLEAMKEMNEGDSDAIASAEDDLYTAITEQQAAAKEVETAAEAANTAEKKLNTASEELNTAQTQVNTAQTNVNTAVKRQQSAAEVQNTITTKANTGATAGNTTAIQSNTLASKLNALGQRALTGAHTLLTGAVTACKGAFNGLKVAMASNPIGLLVTALTTAISLFMTFGDETEEVSENVERFGESSAKSVSKVNTLYEVLKHSDSQSKVYKDAMSELKSTCEEYGIVIDKEGSLIDQLNAKRETLISLIEKEGAARIYANSVAAAEGDYTKTVDNVQKEITEKIKDSLKDSEMADTYGAIITQNLTGNIEALQAAYKNMQEKIKGQATQYNPNGYSTEEVRQATKEYNDLLDKMSLGAREAAKANGENEEALKKLSSETRYNARTMIEGKSAYDKRIETLNRAKDETEKAITATSGLTSEEQRLASQSQLSHLKVSDLQSKVADVLKECSNKHLFEIEVSLNSTKVPKWMQQQLGLDGTRKTTQKDLNEAKGRAALWTSVVEEANRKGTKKVKVAGKTMKTEDAGKRAAEYTVAASQAQENIDKQTADAKAAEKENKKKAEQAAKEAAKTAKDQKKAQETLDKEMLSLRQKNQDEEINLMEDGAEKKKQQIENDYNKQLDTIKTEAEKLAKLNKESGKAGSESVKIGDETVTGLTSEQVEEVNKSIVNAETKRTQEQKEIQKQELEDWREYIKEWGEVQEQRNALIEEWNEKIDKAKTEGQKKSAEAGKKKALADFDFQQLQKSPEYTRAFGNMDETSTGTLKYLLNEFKQALSKNMVDKANPEEVQRYVDIINKLDEELIERDPFAAIASAQRNITEALQRRSAAQDRISKAQSKLNQLEKSGKTGTKEYADALEELKSSQKDYNKAEDDVLKNSKKREKAVDTLTSAFGKLGENISGLGSTIGGEAGEILQFVGQMISTVITSINVMKTAATATSAAIATVEKASAILAIISAVIQLMQALSSLLPDAYDQYKKYAEKIAKINAMRDAVNDYTIAVAEARAEENQWFSGESLRSLKDYAEKGQAAYKAYYEKLYEDQATYQNKSGAGWLTKAGHWIAKVAKKINPLTYVNKAVTTGLEAIGVNTESKAFKVISEIGEIANNAAMFGPLAGLATASDALDNNVYEYQEGITQARYNLRIQTRKASKGFLGTGIGGKSERTEDLTSWVKTNLGLDLFDEEGMLNTEAYEVIMDKYEDKLVGETKDTLEALKDYADTYNEFIENLEEYVENLYSPLIDNFTDAMWDWYDEGTNALDNFRDYASEVFRDIVSDMMKSIMLSDFIDEYSEGLKGIYKKYSLGEIDEGTLFNTVLSLTDTAMKAYKKNLPTYEELLTLMGDKLLDDYGIDLSGSSSSQDSSYGSTSSISQDQADEISGRLTAIQYAGQERNIQLSLANAKLDTIVAKQYASNEIADGIQDILAQSLVHLMNIDTNTEAMLTPIKLVSEKIESWDKIIKNL